MGTAVVVLVLVFVVGIFFGELMSMFLGVGIQTQTIVIGLAGVAALIGVHVCVNPIFVIVDWRVFTTSFLAGGVATFCDNVWAFRPYNTTHHWAEQEEGEGKHK